MDGSTVGTRYWHRTGDGRVQCNVCPRACRPHEGQRGFGFVRMRQQDAIVLTTCGRSSGYCVDPVEKKPLNHFLPGSAVLSFGTAGCNLGCRFCQNWDISKSREIDTLAGQAAPPAIARAATRPGCRSVAVTCNDPVIFLEYAIDVADACREAGIKAVAVAAGYMCAQPRAEFFRHIDAANVDLKGFTGDFYRRACLAALDPVLETLLYLRHETGAAQRAVPVPGPTGWPKASPGCAGRCGAAPGWPAPGNPLAVAQLELLSMVAEHPGVRPGQLARLLHMRPYTVTTIVNALTARGMITRATADQDGRAIELTATDAGQQAVHAWQATNAAVLYLALSALSEPQQRALTGAVPAIDALARAIDRLADTPPADYGPPVSSPARPRSWSGRRR